MGSESPFKRREWLWLLSALIAWAVVFRLVRAIGAFGVSRFTVAVPVITAVIVTVLAWVLVHLSLMRGAPRGLWLAIAAGTVVGGWSIWLHALIVPDAPLYWGSVLVMLLGPSLAAFVESRRLGRLGA